MKEKALKLFEKPSPEKVSEKSKNAPFTTEIVWLNVIAFVLLHISFIYGIYLSFSLNAKILTTMFSFFNGLIINGFGITLGAHRLWTHRSYKAKFPLQLALLIGHTTAGQNCLWVWVRDHRQHHKYSETDADPHNSNRGFFFAHMGWLMVKKHPDVISKGKSIDMSDLNADPLVMFQKKYYKILHITLSMLPVAIPYYAWNETLWQSFILCYLGRITIVLHITWCVNSVAHMFGNRPYNKNIRPVESAFTSFISLGEGWHNYHHTFPWDCHASEFGKYFNLGSKALSGLERIGQAYDLKTATKEIVLNTAKKHGDGTPLIY